MSIWSAVLLLDRFHFLHTVKTAKDNRLDKRRNLNFESCLVDGLYWESFRIDLEVEVLFIKKRGEGTNKFVIMSILINNPTSTSLYTCPPNSSHKIWLRHIKISIQHDHYCFWRHWKLNVFYTLKANLKQNVCEIKLNVHFVNWITTLIYEKNCVVKTQGFIYLFIYLF